MAAYRLYFLDTNNSIQARQDFTAEGDSDASMIGRKLWQACADCYEGYELWQASRRIGSESGIAPAGFEIAGIDRDVQARLLDVQETLLGSHWRAAESATLRAATQTLRQSLDGGDRAGVTQRNFVRYICGSTGAEMMSLQLAEGMRLMLRGSRGFGRIFDEFFAAVPIGHCACGVAFENAQQTVVPAIDASPIFAGQAALDVLRGQGVAACVSTPLLGRDGHIAGMFSIHRDRAWHPLEGELAQLRHIAGDIAAAIADPLGAEARRIGAAV